MENVKDNPQHNAAYEFGFIQAMKLMLQKLVERVGNERDPATGGHYVVILSILIKHCNEMPLVVECGKFRLDIKLTPVSTMVFDWIPAKREQMLDLLNS